MRIVSLACSNTEIVCALGCADMLVGVDDHSDYPVDVVSTLPKVGPDLDIDIDRVAALEPDLVLATLTVPGHEEVVERVEATGLPYIAPEPVSIEDVYRDIRLVADRLGVRDRAESLVRGMRAELHGAEADAVDAEPVDADAHEADADGAHPDPISDGDGDTRRPSILVQWWPKPVITPGGRSWATDVIHAAGGRAVLGHEDHKSRPMTDDEVAEADPDAVVLSWCGVHPEKYRPDVVLRNERWQDLRFVTEERVYCVGEPYLGRPGPRLVEGVRAMRRIVDELEAGSG
jgi:iron complex transport system substrate-binding protein